MSTPLPARRWLTLNALAWIATNAVGVCVFLYFASKTWIEPELRGEDVARGGDAIVWFLTALPSAFACLIVDVFMIAAAARIGRRSGMWSPMIVALGIGVIWGVAMVIDVSHRF